MEASSSLIDKSWINLRYPDKRFISGLEKFVEFTKIHHRNKVVIPCPCGTCQNQGPAKTHDEVTVHCFKYGFDNTYHFWFVHGEVVEEHNAKPPSNFQDEIHDEWDMADALNTVVGELSANNLDTLLQSDPTGSTEQNKLFEDVKFSSNLREAMSELYPGSGDFTILRFVVKLFNLKITHGWTDQSFTALLELFKLSLPSGNNTPKNMYHADKVIKDLGLKYDKIDACRNDCMLYWGDHKSKVSCHICGASRFKSLSIDERKKGVRSTAAKILRYFPLTDRLKRLYRVNWVAKAMCWHSTGKSQPGTMGHPVDSGVWKLIDTEFPEFAAEPRNVRLGLATDGFNPFGSLSSLHSSWPVMCVTYNLPPWLCMKPQFTMLTALIEGPKQPGKDIGVFLQPLVKELNDLWREGVMVRDASKGDVFKMRAVLMWTIHDLPAYGNISGCKTKGKFGCPVCGPNTSSFWLRNGGKHVYMRSRRWLPLTDEARNDTRENTFDKSRELEEAPARLTGIEVDIMMKNLKAKIGKGKQKQNVTECDNDQENDGGLCFTNRSIFFKLDYWKYIEVRHNLDVMHIEKNFCEILIAMMMNTKDKTKDNVKARKDLKRLKIKKRYWLSQVNGKTVMKPGIFWLNKVEKKCFLDTLRNLSVPVGFSGNWSNIVKADSVDLKGLKSHDYHILMQHLLPVLIQHAYRDSKRKEARSIINGICTFFVALCSRRIDIETLNVLERNMIKTLCALEKHCPPSLFVIMMHLPIHLAHEARECGPVWARWMYTFERMMKTYKDYVSNKAHPEGCIAERYLKEETLIHCAGYKGGGGILEKLDRVVENEAPVLPDLVDSIPNHTVDEVGPLGVGHGYGLEGVEYEQARDWVLKSHVKYDYWHRKYTKFIEDSRRTGRRRAGQSRVPLSNDFKTWLKKQPEFLESNDVHFKDIVRGPTGFATTYAKYCVNGFLFVTKDHERMRRNQNSGVSTKCMTTLRSSSKDKNPVEDDVEYYGVLRQIVQLQYREGYKPVLFKCDWVKCTQTGVKMDLEVNLKLVNLSNLISSDRMADEPFIFAERAAQVFYSSDPMDPDWHVVLEVPKKMYSDQDEMCLLSDDRLVNINIDVCPSNVDTMEDEVVPTDPEDMFVVVENKKTKKRKRFSRP